MSLRRSSKPYQVKSMVLDNLESGSQLSSASKKKKKTNNLTRSFVFVPRSPVPSAFEQLENMVVVKSSIALLRATNPRLDPHNPCKRVRHHDSLSQTSGLTFGF